MFGDVVDTFYHYIDFALWNIADFGILNFGRNDRVYKHLYGHKLD